LVHELVHIWQYENWGPLAYVLTAATTSTYTFELYPSTSFESLNMEQQAMVFQDLYLMTNGAPPLHVLNSPSLEDFQDVASQARQ
jgi:hypothetical protein